VDRGVLAVGMAAAVVAFDSATVIDRATYARPTEPAEGIRHVLVNGRVALRDGAPTGTAAGRTLRRGGGMPSRPADFASARSAAVDAPAVTVRLTQGAGDATARGRVRVATGALTLEGTSLGLLQTARGWASVSGRGRVDGAERPFVLILDERDPLDPAVPAATLLLPDRPPLRVALPPGSVRVAGSG